MFIISIWMERSKYSIGAGLKTGHGVNEFNGESMKGNGAKVTVGENRLASYIYRRLVLSKGPARRVWSAARDACIRYGDDPCCSMEVHGTVLRIPTSHPLPLYLSKHPEYDRILGRLGEFVRARHGNLRAIDVGANIGDSIAAMRGDSSDVIVAIEANPGYFQYLESNWGDTQGVDLYGLYCTAHDASGKYEVHEYSGTACITESAGGQQMNARSLDSIVEEHAGCRPVNLIKIDTDGHDHEVIAGAVKTIKEHKPAVLFECEAFSDAKYVEYIMGSIKLFKDAGYGQMLVYDNYGYLVKRQDLSDQDGLKALLFYQLIDGVRYYDLLMMGQEDIEIFYRSEQEYYIKGMSRPALSQAARDAM